MMGMTESLSLRFPRPAPPSISQKVCGHCGVPKPLDAFHKNRNGKFGRHSNCKDCYGLRRRPKGQSTGYSRKQRSRRPEYTMLVHSRDRAQRKGLALDLTVEDIVIPERCPLLGVKLAPRGSPLSKRDLCPSLDRIRSSLGYVKGNVWVISFRANRIKCDATLEELEILVRNLKAKRATLP